MEVLQKKTTQRTWEMLNRIIRHKIEEQFPVCKKNIILGLKTSVVRLKAK
jgi:hypothetical protein